MQKSEENYISKWLKSVNIFFVGLNISDMNWLMKLNNWLAMVYPHADLSTLTLQNVGDLAF